MPWPRASVEFFTFVAELDQMVQRYALQNAGIPALGHGRCWRPWDARGHGLLRRSAAVAFWFMVAGMLSEVLSTLQSFLIL
jgi:hypothetical protein